MLMHLSDLTHQNCSVLTTIITPATAEEVLKLIGSMPA